MDHGLMSADMDSADSLIVMLTEVKGDLKAALRMLSDLIPRVSQHDDDITELKLTTQRLSLQAEAREQTAIALAVALKDAKEAQEAVVRQETEKESRSWSPAAKVISALGALAVLWALLDALIPS